MKKNVKMMAERFQITTLTAMGFILTQEVIINLSNTELA